MRIRNYQLLVCCLAACVFATSTGLQFAAADLYVLRVGDGLASRTNASTAVFIDRFSNTGALLGTIPMPQSASGSNNPFTISGTATSEGFLALSSNGQFLTLGGYAAEPGITGIANTDSESVNRVVGRIDVNSGTVDTSTALSDDSFSGSNIRSVASTNGIDFWAGGNSSPGGNGGVRYTTLGSASSTQVVDNPNNSRVVKIFDGQLYLGSGSNPFRGVSEVGVGLPTELDSAILLPGFSVQADVSPGASSYDFWFRDDSTVYVADDRSLANGGGIQKWEFNVDTWELSYTLDAGGTPARGLTGRVDGGNTVLFATTTQTSANNLISLVDTGPSSTANILTSAPADTAFRGLAFVDTGAPPVGDGDFNNDGVVDGFDFLDWQRGNSPNNGSPGDLATWEANFGSGAPLSAIAAVPEPSSLGLLLLAAVPMVLRRR